MSKPAEAYYSDRLFELGFGDVLVCRYKSGGRVEVGVFLVDIYCLGVKDSFFVATDELEFREEILQRFFPDGVPSPRPGAWGRKLVEGAVEYARQLGLSPHSDYKKGARVFGGINADDCDEVFTYGKDGKPFFISSPSMSSETVQRILNLLTAKCGEGGFDSIVGVDLEDDEDFDEEDEEDFLILVSDTHAHEPNAVEQQKIVMQAYLDSLSDEDPTPEFMPLEETFMAEEFLSGAKDMWAVMKEEGGEVLPLQEIMRLFQFTWNLAIMEEEDRVSTLEAVPSDFRQFVLDSIENFTKQVSENSPKPFIVHFGLFEDNGEHRLILLFEP